METSSYLRNAPDCNEGSTGSTSDKNPKFTSKYQVLLGRGRLWLYTIFCHLSSNLSFFLFLQKCPILPKIYTSSLSSLFTSVLQNVSWAPNFQNHLSSFCRGNFNWVFLILRISHIFVSIFLYLRR